MWALALSEHVQKAGSINRHPLSGVCCDDGRVKLPAPMPTPTRPDISSDKALSSELG